MEKQQIARPKPANHREGLRQRIPKFYNPFIFFTLTNLIACAAIYYSAKLIRNPSLAEWLTILAIFLFANFVEYLFHKGPMHNRIRFGIGCLALYVDVRGKARSSVFPARHP